MINEAFEKWAKEQGYDMEIDVDGSYKYISTEDAYEAYQAGRNAALTEAEKACDAVCSEKANDWGDGYNQGALICSAEIRGVARWANLKQRNAQDTENIKGNL